jgi:hypothetical protein
MNKGQSYLEQLFQKDFPSLAGKMSRYASEAKYRITASAESQAEGHEDEISLFSAAVDKQLGITCMRESSVKGIKADNKSEATPLAEFEAAVDQHLGLKPGPQASGANFLITGAAELTQTFTIALPTK